MWCIVMQAANALKMFARAWIPAVGLLAAAGLGEALAGGGAGPREVGLWIDDTGKGAVRIEPCGNKLCGRIAWLKEPLNAEGQPRIDRNNPDPGKQNRPICGLPILGQLGPLPEGGYDGGWVYDPKVGKSYDVAIELTGPNRLQVTGYKGVRFLGKSFMWTRADTELAPCDAQSAAGAVPAAGAAASVAKTSPAKQPTAAVSAPAPAAKPSSANAPPAGAVAKTPAATAPKTSGTTAAKPTATSKAPSTANAKAVPSKATASELPWAKKPAPGASAKAAEGQTPKSAGAVARPKPVPQPKPAPTAAAKPPDGDYPEYPE